MIVFPSCRRLATIQLQKSDCQCNYVTGWLGLGWTWIYSDPCSCFILVGCVKVLNNAIQTPIPVGYEFVRNRSHLTLQWLNPGLVRITPSFVGLPFSFQWEIKSRFCHSWLCWKTYLSQKFVFYCCISQWDPDACLHKSTQAMKDVVVMRWSFFVDCWLSPSHELLVSFVRVIPMGDFCCAPDLTLVVRSGPRKKRHNNHPWGIHPTGGDSMQAEKQPTQQEQQPTEKSNQHTNLTRFGNVPTSSGQGRERSYWFNNQYKQLQGRILEGGKGFLLGIF